MEFTNEIEELERLRREGMLSEWEFEKAKVALIQRLSGANDPATQRPRTPRSTTALVIGVVLALVGAFMTAGIAIVLQRQPPPEEINEAIIVGILLGVFPFLLGSYLALRNAR